MKLSITISFLFFVHSSLAFHASSSDYSGVGMDFLDRFGRPRAHILALRDNPDNFTEDQASAGYAATCNGINSATGLPAVQADINNLLVNSIAIEGQFLDVLTQLTAIDNRSLTTQEFAPGWNVLYGQWTDILWASRNTASDTVAYAQNFIDTVMPFVANTSGPGCPPALGIEVLQEYIAEAQGLKDRAQNTSQSFASLQTALVVFTASFQNFTTYQGQSTSASINQLQAEVRSLVSQISTLTDQITALGVGLRVSLFSEVGILALLPIAGPFVIALGIAAVVNAGAIVAQSAALNSLTSQRNSLAAKRDSDIKQIAQLERTLAQIASANQTLGTITNQTIPSLVTQLDAFDHIWDAVVADAQSAVAYLTQLTSPVNQLVPQIFWSTANHVPCIYEALIPALNSFISGIANSSIPAPSTAVRSTVLDHAQFRISVSKKVSKAQLRAVAAMSSLEL